MFFYIVFKYFFKNLFNILSFLVFTGLLYVFATGPISIRILLMIFCILVSLLSGYSGLVYYNRILLIPLLRGVCVLFYYISFMCFNRDDDSVSFDKYMLIVVFYFIWINECDYIHVNSENYISNIIFWYNSDSNLCILSIIYLCFSLIIVLKLCGGMFIPLSGLEYLE